MPVTVGCGVVIEVNSVSALATGATANVTKTNTHARRNRFMCARDQSALTSHGRIADVAMDPSAQIRFSLGPLVREMPETRLVSEFDAEPRAS